jgi:hypothetical protein
MSDKDINKMDFKGLKNEVQLLRDELAIFKRRFNDTVYNLDADNFGKSFTLEQNKMKTQVEVTSKAIRTMVSNEDLKAYSTIEQTAADITFAVSAEREYVTNLLGTDYYTKEESDTKISASADGVLVDVSKVYKTTSSAEADFKTLDGKISGVSDDVDDLDGEIYSLWTQVDINADGISSIVSKNITAYFESSVKPTNSNTSPVQKSMLCLYDSKYYYFDDRVNTWTLYPADGIKTIFKQTDSGFEFTGDVTIRGAGNDLYIGDGLEDGERNIIFNNGARIRLYQGSSSGYHALLLDASDVTLSQLPSRIFIKNPDKPSTSITLEDYVTSHGAGDGTVVAVFG